MGKSLAKAVIRNYPATMDITVELNIGVNSPSIHKIADEDTQNMY